MTRDEELWACALEVIKQHGDEAPLHVGRRIYDLTLKGELAGVETWMAIAEKIDALNAAKQRPQ